MTLQPTNGQSLFILLVIILHITVYCIDATQTYENKDINKYKLDPTRYIFEIFKQNQKFMPLPATTHKNRTTLNNSVTEASHVKKWQVGRVSRKQYEIINMLWRKTKEFPDVEISTVSNHPGYPLYRLPSRLYPSVTTSTPSFIEFYYLNENDDRNKDSGRKHPSKDAKAKHLKKPGSFDISYPIFAFHIDNRNTKTAHKIEALSPPLIGYLNAATLKRANKNGLNKRTPGNLITVTTRLSSMTTKKLIVTEPLYIVDNNTCPLTTQDLGTEGKEITEKYPHSYFAIDSYLSKSTKPYDKIKFFEMYDKHTPSPYYREEAKPIDLDDIEKSIHIDRQYNKDQRILLEHVDQRLGDEHGKINKPNHAKKHIIENNRSYSKYSITDNLTSQSTQSFIVSTIKTNNIRNLQLNESLSSKSKLSIMPENIINKVAIWSDYSFMAVYIYEPAQVHCDAAGISPHWLVTSGSCLSRHHKNPDGEGRTAFVAYCGASWWTAERIAYVKYSVVHPHFHQRDNNRRYMYNIGLIQVVISLTTCPGWAPISLMSHRFVADPGGSYANAVGWGLDRYNTRYTSADLPKYPLMAYESRVFSDSCPGSLSYTQLTRQVEEDVVQNLYCLGLPPYLGEDTDPIHGSMLVVEGKLCAIYLQEERRPSGEQSAEYTGTWRLGPWVSRVAREPDDAEPFTFII